MTPFQAVRDLDEGQKYYVRRRVRRASEALFNLVRAFNPALGIKTSLDMHGRRLVMRIVEARPDKSGTRVHATLHGRFELKWNFGKRLYFLAQTTDQKGINEIPLHRRGYITASQMYEILRPKLPQPAGLPLRTFHAPMINENNNDMAPEKLAARKKIGNAKRKARLLARFNVQARENEHDKYIQDRIKSIEAIFAVSTRHMFNQVSFEWNHRTREAHEPLRLNIRLRPKTDFHVPGTPREIWIAGDLSLRWRANGGNGTRLDFIPRQGLPGDRYAPLNFSRGAGDVTCEIYNLLVAGEMLRNTSYQTKGKLLRTSKNSERRQIREERQYREQRKHRRDRPRKRRADRRFDAMTP